MRFYVVRTSARSGDDSPCEGAVRVSVPRWDTTWPVDSLLPLTRRIEDKPGWEIELATLDDLLALERLHGEIMLTSSPYQSEPRVGRLQIEIYDDYRE